MSKSCSKCTAAKCKNKTPDPHECPKNHVGSSKSMECEAIDYIVKEAYFNLGYTIETIISDDDSTMKSNLKHSYEQKVNAKKMSIDEWLLTAKGNRKKDNGRLPLEIPEPSFRADFNHRVKVVGKSLYVLANMPKKDSTVDKATAERIKTNWGSMLKQVKN
jgi:hypothetical protein